MFVLERFVQILQVRRRRLFHFTDSRNIDSIRDLGLLPTDVLVRRDVEVVFGGDEASLAIDRRKGLDGFVRLSFCRNHPMSHTAQERGTIEQPRILTVCPTVLLREGVQFADRVATANDAQIGDPNELIPNMDMVATYDYLDWSTPENYERRAAAEKWEALVPEPIATDLIIGL